MPGEMVCAVIGSGFATSEAKTALAQMHEGDTVRLDRVPANGGNDPNAVTCLFLGLQVGWIPRKLNPPVAAAMDRGAAVTATCVRSPELAGKFVKKEALIRVVWS